MKKTVILLAIAVVFTLAGCKKDKQSEEPVVPPVVQTDLYLDFKADATPRWENGATVQKNEKSAYVFITDAGGSLFASAKYKTGRISADGSDFEIIEFSGAPAVGKPTEPSIRKPSGSVALNSLEIVKIESGKLWIVFKETASSTERRIVQ